MRPVIVVTDPRTWRARGTPGGLSLLERQMRQLRALGFAPPVLLIGAHDPVPPVALAHAAIVRVPDATDVAAALADAVDDLPDEFLVLAADRIVDARILTALAARRRATFACVTEAAEPVGRASVAELRRDGIELVRRAERLPIAALDPYVPELRGSAAPYVLRAGTVEERRHAWRVLLDSVQKRTLDLPGQYFDTPFENFLVRALAPTAVTPNHVTSIALVLAIGVGILLLHGWLRTAVIGALAVGILDGVDGKLARLKLATSTIGTLEHVGDFFYENFWYLALAAWLDATTGPPYWRAGVALVLLDLTDNVLYLLVQLRTGRMLDELTPFDGAFRRIAGRRNVYVMMFAVGCFSGDAAAALACAVGWAAVTVVVHALRASMTLVGPWPHRARAVPRRPAMEASDGERSFAGTVREARLDGRAAGRRLRSAASAQVVDIDVGSDAVVLDKQA